MASERSVAEGSSAPGPVPKGKIRIYSMRFCPFAQRARLVLAAKGIRYDIININLKNKPSWFLEKNPLGAVPVLETDHGEIIYESPIVCEYLDEMYKQKKLFPEDPFEKAKQKMLLEEFSKVIPYFYKVLTGRSKCENTSAAEQELKEKLAKLNETLLQKKTRFFGGNSVTMIDYLMWPWFERVDGYGVRHCLDGASQLQQWMQDMMDDPVIKATMFDSETHKAFLQSFCDGKPNYDLGL
ncbi:glutathione S-transferase omega 1-like [Scleropages formosus]|uniref:Glutathione S-transferase omega n=1 Tax=Scleropages formosus TaxID=113540 RepID=A0A0P7UB17_SCLFO|nr:glutathione S-transferase omega-1 [Scleropages formosus]XP_018595734.1 glutathione S-transferase omega-1 [Scleropages formosus]KPP64823.1 glutathione S-transferase omega 1-like [Scleropages formosus]